MGCFASNSKNNKIEVSNPVKKKQTLDSLPSTIKENLKETDSGSKFTRKIQKEKEKKLLPEISKLSPIESREPSPEMQTNLKRNITRLDEEFEEKDQTFKNVFIKDPEWANKNVAGYLKSFKWSDEGFVEIKSISFQIKYDQAIKGFREVKTNENLQSSILSWKKSDKDGCFCFDITDINTYNLRTGKTTKNPLKKGIKFGVGLDGIDLGAEPELKKNANLDFIDEEVEKIWNKMVGYWISSDFSNKNDKVYEKTKYCEKECAILSHEEIAERSSIIEFLFEKLKETNNFIEFINSPYYIKSGLKKWDEETNKSYSKFDINNVLIHLMENYLNFSCIYDLEESRPFIINCENTKKIVFDYNDDLFADIDQEFSVMLFLWKDIGFLQKEDYILSEASNFKDFCRTNYHKTIKEAYNISSLPLFSRPKEYSLLKENNSMISNQSKYITK